MKKLYTGPFGSMARDIWTKKAIQKIKANVSDTFLFILPTQTLLKKVRHDLLTATGGFSNVHLLTFDEIAQLTVKHAHSQFSILNTYEWYQYFDQIFQAIEDEPAFSFFKPYLHLQGVKQGIIHVLGELKRSGFTVKDAQHLLHKQYLAEQQKALCFAYIESEKKLEQLNNRKGTCLLSPEHCLEKAAHILTNHQQQLPVPLANVDTVWVDHFTDFTPLQFRLLEGIVHTKKVEKVGIYLPYEESMYDSLKHLHPLVQKTLMRLEKSGFVHDCFTNETKSLLSQTIAQDWGMNPEKDSNQQETIDTVILPCASEKKEVMMVAKAIKQSLLANKTRNLEDIAVIVRDKARYEAYIHEVFTQQQLPITLPKKQRVLEVPLIQQFFSLFHLIARHWHRDDLIKLAEGAYIYWNHPVPIGLSTWLHEKGIVSGRNAWLQSVEREQAYWDERISQLKHDEELSEEERQKREERFRYEKEKVASIAAWMSEVNELLSVLQNKTTCLEHVNRTTPFIEQLNIEGALRTLIKQKEVYATTQLKRDIDSYQMLKASLHTLREANEKLGTLNRPMTLATFIQEWESILAEHKVTIVGGQESGIRILEPSAARGLQFADVYVLGCNEGSFPIQHRENWLLDDGERLVLQENGTLPASHFHNEMEKLFFTMTNALPTQSIVYTHVSHEVNENALRSQFLDEVEHRIQQNKGTQVRQITTQTNSLLNDEQFLVEAAKKRLYSTCASQLASAHEYRLWLLSQVQVTQGKITQDQTTQQQSSDDESTHTHSWAHPMALSHIWNKQWLSRQLLTHVLQGLEVEYVRKYGAFSAWDGLLNDTFARDELAKLFSPERSYSISQINEYMSSPLTFFFKRVLGIQPLEELDVEVSALHKGNILHETLRTFYDRHRGERLEANELEAYREELLAIFEQEAQKYAQGSIYEQSVLWTLEVKRLKKELSSWLTQEIQTKKAGDLRPQYLELSFGLPIMEDQPVDKRSSTQPIRLDLAGEPLQLYGKIDRIDMDDAGNYIVYDYKLSLGRYNSYKKLIDDTVTYQIPLYLRAVQQWLQQQDVQDASIVGGTFYSLKEKDKFKKIGLWDKEKKALAGLSSQTRKGVFEDVQAQIDADMLEVKEELHRLRNGYFHLTTQKKPNNYYADNALYRYDVIDMRYKEKKQSGEEEKDDES